MEEMESVLGISELTKQVNAGTSVGNPDIIGVVFFVGTRI
jgi:hypothetical protein